MFCQGSNFKSRGEASYFFASKNRAALLLYLNIQVKTVTASKKYGLKHLGFSH
jgi:hypothetical protein